ncbi:MAG: CBS domain-containing protein, partial [Anaerolineaceae bacterium]|nr:CBS domain-containing protein [Anaerolineaceae bacterium]
MSDQVTLSDNDAGKITRVEELGYELKISQVMTADVVTFSPDMSMLEALDLIQKNHISGAPVTQNGEVVGIISTEDLIRALRDGRIDRKVSDYMSTSLITANANDQVVEALKVFARKTVGRLPVLDE